MSAEVLRDEQDGELSYQVTKTDRGYLVTMRNRRSAVIWMPAEWLHRTCEAADACLDAIKVFHAEWLAIQTGHSANDLLRTADARNITYKQTCERLNDYPLIGPEVKALRDEG